MGWVLCRGSAACTVPAWLRVLQSILFTGPVLEQLTCERSPAGLRRLLRVGPAQQPVLQAYRMLACNGSRAARRDRFTQLAAELRDQLDTPRIISRVSTGL